VNRRLWAVLAIVPLLFGVGSIFLQRAGGVVLFDDEMGFLGTGVLLSLRPGIADLTGMPFYSSGYGLVLAGPLSVFPVDPWVVAVGVNLALLAALGPLLFVLCTRALEMPRRAAVGAALLGATVPSVVLTTPRAWSETLMAVAFAVWVVLLERYSRIGPVRGAIPLALSSGWMIAVHRRAAAVALLGLLAIAVSTIWSARRPGTPRDDDRWLRRIAWRPLAIAQAAGLAAAVSALTLDRYVAGQLYDGAGGGERLGKISNLFSTVWLSGLAGQLWALAVSTFGIALVGALVLVTWAIRRHRTLFGVTLLLAVAGVLMTSVLFLAHGVRADHLVYERYVAPFAPVLVTLGFGSLIGRQSPRWHIPTALGIAVGLAAVLRLVVDQARLGGDVQKMTVPALTSLDLPTVGWNHAFAPAVHVVPVTLAAVAALTICAVVSRYGVSASLALLLLPAAVVAAGSAGNLQPFLNVWEPTGRDAAALLEAEGVEQLQVLPGLSSEARTVLQYRLEYPPVVRVDAPTCDISRHAIGPGQPGIGRIVARFRPIGGVLYELDC
jgi:hypothetical protein